MRKTLIGIVAVTLIAAGPSFAGWDEGVAAFTKKDFQAAAAEFQQVIEASPDAHAGYYMLGLSLEQLGKAQDAFKHLRKAYDLNPNDLGTKLALGRVYTSLRRYGDAAKLLSNVDASALPAAQKAAFYQMRGRSRFETDDMGGALQDFQELAKLRPQDAQTQYLYGQTALAMGQVDAGVNALAKAAQLKPSDLDIKTGYVKALVRQARVSRDKTAKKQTYLRAAGLAKELSAAQSTYDNLMLQVSAELGAGLYNEAAATGQKAIAKNDKDWTAHYYVGQAYTSAGKYEEAVEPLKQALTLAKDPNDVKKIHIQQGFALEKQKKYAESIEAYQAAGDTRSVARVQENQKVALDNARIEEENKLIEQMRKEQEELEKQLKELEGGGGGR